MQHPDVVSKATAEIALYLPQAARPGTSLGRAGDARALFVVIERAVRLYHQEAALCDFVHSPHGPRVRRLRHSLHQIVRADPMLAADIQTRLEALAGNVSPAPVPASPGTFGQLPRRTANQFRREWAFPAVVRRGRTVSRYLSRVGRGLRHRWPSTRAHLTTVAVPRQPTSAPITAQPR